METIENNVKIKENSVEALVNGSVKAINQIKEFVANNDYKFNKPIEIKSGLFSSTEKLLKNKIDDMSLNQRKRFKRAINHFLIKQTISSANRFLHFLYKNVLKSEDRVRISYSDKQLSIIAARKKYVEARKVMLEMLDAYKEEKGDFYIQRIKNNQKIQ